MDQVQYFFNTTMDSNKLWKPYKILRHILFKIKVRKKSDNNLRSKNMDLNENVVIRDSAQQYMQKNFEKVIEGGGGT